RGASPACGCRTIARASPPRADSTPGVVTSAPPTGSSCRTISSVIATASLRECHTYITRADGFVTGSSRRRLGLVRVPPRVRDDERTDRLRRQPAALQVGERLAGHRLGEPLVAVLVEHLRVRERNGVAGAAVVDPPDERAVDAELVALRLGVVGYARLHERTLAPGVVARPG